MRSSDIISYAVAIVLLFGGSGAIAAAQVPARAEAPRTSPTMALGADDDPTGERAAFVARLRAATQRFQDHAAAVAAGYRWVGPDMPNMGEHWINPRLVMRRPFDPMRPSCLSYVQRNGQRILTGVAYVLPLRPGDVPPSLPIEAEWHYHASTLDEEAFGHQPHHHEPDEENTVQLAMLHAWIWAPNPTGTFSADNWAVSFMRQGFSVPDTVRPSAAKALFLLTENGVSYFLRMVTANASPTDQERAVISDALQAARQQVGSVIQDVPDGKTPDANVLTSLWRSTWHSIQSDVRVTLWDSLHPVMLGEAH